MIKLALPITRDWALVPSREKAEVLRSVTRLRHESLEMPGMPVFGIVDADRDEASDSDHILQWPVAMIENLLLDAEVINAALRPYGQQTRAESADAVQRALDELVTVRIEEEVQLRVRKRLPVGRLVFDLTSETTADKQAADQASVWATRVQKLDLGALEATAREEVARIVTEGTALERFHGKRLLRGAYDKLGVSGSGLSHSAFALTVAAHAAGTDRVMRLATTPIDRIRLFFPEGLAPLLADVEGEQAARLAARCAEQRSAWDAGTPDAHGRESLRAEVFAFGTDHDPIRSQLAALASEIGTLS